MGLALLIGRGYEVSTLYRCINFDALDGALPINDGSSTLSTTPGSKDLYGQCTVLTGMIKAEYQKTKRMKVGAFMMPDY